MTEQKRIVFLTGFMGSGKSTVGPELARKIGYDFIDMDNLIEEAEGASISDIFKLHGETYFRERESETLDRLSRRPESLVVALGGGALTNEASRGLVRSRGVLVYLQASPEKILERVGRDRNRPMLTNSDGRSMNDVELTSRVESLLSEREKYYMSANLIIDTSDLTISESVDVIASKLKGLIE